MSAAKVQRADQVFIVGVDPGKEGGLALWNAKTGKFLAVDSFSFWQLIEQLEAWRHLVGLAVVEDPRGSPMWSERGGGNWRRMFTIGRSLGRVDRDAEIIISWFEARDIPVISRSTAGKAAKMDKARFRTLTKWEGRTNQHGRDAGALVFGMNLSHIRNAR